MKKSASNKVVYLAVYEGPDMLLISVEFLRRVCRNEAVWFLYLVLKSFSVSPMYVSMVLVSFPVTVAL